jgi:pSer/pThr/pTyr-binding forkhead associated (FHA) protein
MDNPSNNTMTDNDNASDATVQWQLNALTEALGDLSLSVVDSLSIGRGQDNDVVLGSKQISRNHALLSVLNGQLYLKDLASSNGTFVNDEQIEANKSKQLNEADKVSFAAFSFAVAKVKAAAPVSAMDTAADKTADTQDTMAEPKAATPQPTTVDTESVAATEQPVTANMGNIPAQDAVAKLDTVENTPDTENLSSASSVEPSVTELSPTSDSVTSLEADINETETPDPLMSEPDALESVLPPVPLESLSSVNVESVSNPSASTDEGSQDSKEAIMQQPVQPLQANLETSTTSDDEPASSTVEPLDPASQSPVVATDEVEDAVIVDAASPSETVADEPVVVDTESETATQAETANKPTLPTEPTPVLAESLGSQPVVEEPPITEEPAITEAPVADPVTLPVAETTSPELKQDQPTPMAADPKPTLTPSEPLQENTMSSKETPTTDSSSKDPHDKTTTTELQQEADPDVLRAKQAATSQLSGTANLGGDKDLGTAGNNAMDQALNNTATNSDIHKKPSGGWFIWVFIGLIILGIALWMFNMGGVGG